MKNLVTIILILIPSYFYAQSEEAEIKYLEGLLKSRQKNFEGAIKDYNAALDLAPSDSIELELIIARADAKRFFNDDIGAISDYSKAIKLSTDKEINYHCYKMRGGLKMGKEDYRGAASDFSEIINLDKNDCDANYSRGLCYGNLEKYSEAIIDFNQAIRICDEKADSYLYLGISWIALGDKETGCSNFSKSGELGSKEAYEKILEYCK